MHHSPHFNPPGMSFDGTQITQLTSLPMEDLCSMLIYGLYRMLSLNLLPLFNVIPSSAKKTGNTSIVQQQQQQEQDQLFRYIASFHLCFADFHMNLFHFSEDSYTFFMELKKQLNSYYTYDIGGLGYLYMEIEVALV